MTGNFDLVAPVYDALASVVFGQRLQRAQLVWLNEIPAGATVLIIGGGTGQLLEPLLNQCQPSRVLYLETSARMLARASQRMVRHGLLGTVEFRLGDETTLQDDEPFDVIITPFLLDLFTGTTLRTRLIPRLLAILKPAGLWLVTDFVNTSVWWQKALLWSMIRFFQLTASIETQQLTDWQQSLNQAGLMRRKQSYWVGGMVSTEVWTR
jgi:ubiquinone/menaquinone biosynthesis C-methylase UbiE